MLVSLKDVLSLGRNDHTAVGSFNTPNLESLIAVISAAEELNRPVIVMHAEIHEELMPLDVIGPIMVREAQRASVPVCVHLDHGTDISYLKKALETGFTSVMYDGSVLDYEQNFTNTKATVELARKFNASVEAELGVMGRRETGKSGGSESEPDTTEQQFTDPDTAKKFAMDTGIDALACAFGTAHGIYLKAPALDFERVRKIRSLLDIPLVMHGGSGVSADEFRKAISCGIGKINYYTYMSKSGYDVVKETIGQMQFYHDIVACGIDAMKNDVKQAIRVFSLL